MKISGLRENPRAYVQVDEIESDLHWRSAIAFGKFEEIKNPNERTDVLNKLLRSARMLQLIAIKRISLRRQDRHILRYRSHSEKDCPGLQVTPRYKSDTRPRQHKALWRTFRNGPHVEGHQS
jgi:nitroimidazol reductase NimA-like FMN-containing flavoprotein (pyridoxamine 5'-phosphate oxidase superfamily)